MSQRTEKVQSLVRQIVATALTQELGQAAAKLGVSNVDVSPDLKHATVWLDIAETNESKRQTIMTAAQEVRPKLQAAVATVMTTKYIPKLELKLDTGADYADHINGIIREL